MTAQVFHGDCMDVLAGMAANTVDAIVTDPPYEIGFMGKGWDGSGIAYRVELWAECLRVLKPGGHLLAFGGTRTYHRMASAIDDAGFDVRDSLHWIYGSGFPKSLDVSKAIDKMDAADEQDERRLRFTAWVRSTGVTSRQIDEATGTNMGGHYTTAASQPAVMTREHLEACRELFGDVPRWVEQESDIRSVESRNFAEREVVGTKKAVPGVAFTSDGPTELDVTAPATDAARQWAGFGTALKPAHEPIVVARKPLTGTVAATVLTHGTGALNIDGCRVAGALEGDPNRFAKTDGGTFAAFTDAPVVRTAGRWPANLVLTHAHNCTDTCADGCPVAELDRQSGNRPGATGKTQHGSGTNSVYGTYTRTEASTGNMGTTDAGGASRFFTITEWDPTADVPPFRYVPKPSKRERNAGLDGLEDRAWRGNYGDGIQDNRPHTREGYTYEATTKNHHPTVKPVNLLRWLVRLVTPPGGVVLDPFAGSGTTLVAATLEQFDCIGIELTDDYHPIIAGRVAWAETHTGTPHPPRAPTTARTATPTTEPPLTLFDVGATE